MVVGDKIIYRHTLNQNLNLFGFRLHNFNAEVVRDAASFTISGGRITVLESGRYIIRSNSDWDSALNNRINRVLATFLNGSEIVDGRSAAYSRTTTDDKGFMSTFVILDLVAGDIIDVRSIRLSTVVGAHNLRTDSSISIYQIDNSDPMFKAHVQTGDLTDYASAAYDGVYANAEPWDTEDVKDSGYTFTAPSTDVTLDAVGFYLVAVSFRIDHVAGGGIRSAYGCRVTVGGVAQKTSYGYTYQRGSITGNTRGCLNVMALVQSTAINQVLNFQIQNLTTGTLRLNPIMRVLNGGNGITIVKVPDGVAKMIISDAGGAEELNPAASTNLNHDTNDLVETGFTHAVNGDVGLDNNGDDYLLGACYFGTNVNSGARSTHKADWRDVDNAVFLNSGRFGSYRRGNQGNHDTGPVGGNGTAIIHDVTDSKDLWRLQIIREGSTPTVPSIANQNAMWGLDLSQWVVVSTTPIGRTWNVRHDISEFVNRTWNVRHDISEFISRTWNLRHDISQLVDRIWNIRHDILALAEGGQAGGTAKPIGISLDKKLQRVSSQVLLKGSCIAELETPFRVLARLCNSIPILIQITGKFKVKFERLYSSRMSYKAELDQALNSQVTFQHIESVPVRIKAKKDFTKLIKLLRASI